MQWKREQEERDRWERRPGPWTWHHCSFEEGPDKEPRDVTGREVMLTIAIPEASASQNGSPLARGVQLGWLGARLAEAPTWLLFVQPGVAHKDERAGQV